jgi:lysophospholipase L1-like esterase
MKNTGSGRSEMKKVLLLFATTTPVPPGAYRNDWVVQYNDEAQKLMAGENIAVNDLYALMCRDKNLYKCEDGLHLTEEGYRLCAAQAARMIEEKLGLQ